MELDHLVRAAPGQRVGNDVRGQNGTRHEEATELFGDDPEVADALTRDAASAKFFGNQHGGPTKLGPLRPDVTIEAQWIADHRTECRRRPRRGEKSVCRLTQQLLFG